MMKNKLIFKRIATAICLLVMVGILCILSSMRVYASGSQDADNVLNIGREALYVGFQNLYSQGEKNVVK